MFTIITNFGAFLGLLIAIFKDYLKGSKLWPRKHEAVVAKSISITAVIIGLTNTIPYLLLVGFVYHDWLVTLRTLSGMLLALITLLIGLGFWMRGNENIPIWTLLLQTLKIGNAKSTYEVLLVPQNDMQIAEVQQKYPQFLLVSRCGGKAFVTENCKSLKEVEIVQGKYHDLGLYVTYIEAAR